MKFNNLKKPAIIACVIALIGIVLYVGYFVGMLALFDGLEFRKWVAHAIRILKYTVAIFLLFSAHAAVIYHIVAYNNRIKEIERLTYEIKAKVDRLTK